MLLQFISRIQILALNVSHRYAPNFAFKKEWYSPVVRADFDICVSSFTAQRLSSSVRICSRSSGDRILRSSALPSRMVDNSSTSHTSSAQSSAAWEKMLIDLTLIPPMSSLYSALPSLHLWNALCQLTLLSCFLLKSLTSVHYVWSSTALRPSFE